MINDYDLLLCSPNCVDMLRVPLWNKEFTVDLTVVDEL